MQAIRDIVDVKSNKITYELPSRFSGKRVELIVLPVDDKPEEKVEELRHAGVSLRGKLKSFANPALREAETMAWNQAARAKHETN